MTTKITEVLPPHDTDAEASVLGSILIDPDSYYEIAAWLKPEHFYRLTHRHIYTAVAKLADAGTPLDFVTLTHELNAAGQLDDVGGEVAIVELMNTVPTAVNVLHYAKIVKATAARRQIITAAGRMAAIAYDSTIDTPDAISRAEAELFAATDAAQPETIQTARELLAEQYDETARRYEAGGMDIGLPTGLIDLDRKLGGLKAGELTILAARPGMGKTALQLSIILRQILRGARIALFSLEMTGDAMMRRLVTQHARLPYDALQSGRLSEEQWAAYGRAIGRLSETALYVDSPGTMTPTELAAKARRLHGRYGLDAIYIDYLQLMQTGTNGRHSQTEEVTEISRALKQLAMSLKVPVIALSQLNRSVEARQNKRPMLSDLRQSGSIEQDADVVAMLYRDDYYAGELAETPNVAELNIAKHRNGETGLVSLFFDAEFMGFSNLATQEVDLG